MPYLVPVVLQYTTNTMRSFKGKEIEEHLLDIFTKKSRVTLKTKFQFQGTEKSTKLLEHLLQTRECLPYLEALLQKPCGKDCPHTYSKNHSSDCDNLRQ